MTVRIVRGSIEEIAIGFRKEFEIAARSAVESRGSFSIAVPGGSVTEFLLPELVSADVDWGRADVFFADERGVPPDDPESNYALCRAKLFNRIPIDGARIHRMEAERPDLPEAARSYERVLIDRVGNPPRLDLLILGVGPDGHLASLFPGRPEIEIGDRWVVSVEDAPKPPPRRMTLTLPALLAARALFLAAFGLPKQQLIEMALNDPSSELPVARVARNSAATLLLGPDGSRTSGGIARRGAP